MLQICFTRVWARCITLCIPTAGTAGCVGTGLPGLALTAAPALPSIWHVSPFKLLVMSESFQKQALLNEQSALRRNKRNHIIRLYLKYFFQVKMGIKVRLQNFHSQEERDLVDWKALAQHLTPPRHPQAPLHRGHAAGSPAPRLLVPLFPSSTARASADSGRLSTLY